MIELIVDGSKAITLNDDGTIDIIKDKEALASIVGDDNVPSFVNIIED